MSDVDLTGPVNLLNLDVRIPYYLETKEPPMDNLEQIDLAMSVLPSSYLMREAASNKPMRRLSMLEGMEYERRLKRDVGLSGAFYGAFLGEDKKVRVKKEIL